MIEPDAGNGATADARGWDVAAAEEIEAAAIAWAIRNRLHGGGTAAFAPTLETGPPGFDPTRGATRFHRHDERPEWARHHLPVALIGRYLFYVA